jgi:hypothetical protein
VARSIIDSVGEKGKNLEGDVFTIQQLLNGVLPAFGGPVVKLKVDGICGPKTKAAIQNFQLKQFGWPGADGRVDPGKRTLARLNELSFGSLDPPKPPDGPGPSILPESTRFVIHRMGNEESFGQKEEDLFFHIVDMTNGFMGIYFLARSQTATTTAQPRLTFRGPSRSFNTKGAHPVDRLDCDAVYMTTERDGALSSTFVLNLKSGAIQIPMPHHLIGPNGIISQQPGAKGNASTWISGAIKFIRPA